MHDRQPGPTRLIYDLLKRNGLLIALIGMTLLGCNLKDPLAEHRRRGVDIMSEWASQHNTMGRLRQFGLHTGVDLGPDADYKIIAPADGEILAIDLNDTVYGTAVSMVHPGETPLYTWYVHLHSVSVKVGQEVKRGDVIGLMGRTGATSTLHLHWSWCKAPCHTYPRTPSIGVEATMDPLTQTVGCYERDKTYPPQAFTYPVRCSK